jgi:hypothetical protein
VPDLAIFGQLTREQEFRCIVAQADQKDRLNDPLRKPFAEVSQVGLQPADHDGVELARAHRDATREVLRVEDLEQA